MAGFRDWMVSRAKEPSSDVIINGGSVIIVIFLVCKGDERMLWFCFKVLEMYCEAVIEKIVVAVDYSRSLSNRATSQPN